ncbi:S1 RNA binding domain protein [Selenomonas sp. GACV-9]|uniref:S1 domain-containing RNA-binding protein n=1 Tax=Selenomonas sp. GACV-9 TaxID=3158782 RepID=UPI0008E4C721|nr:RNA-binding protein S1 [Selenomonas ruminantium]MBQ1889817.1 RNA-binding protein S1 [Selenomonas sp.]SFT89186.1 S1 RNA binding domain protein [Selenomonas ruminantium]
MSIEVGSVVEGVVSGITNFGAFIELPEGKTGLVHISEVADVYVKDVHDFLTEKDKVKVKVLTIDEKGKIGLSIKQTQEKKPEEHATTQQHAATNNSSFRTPRPARGPRDFRKPNNRFNNTSASFEDKLSRFLKDSDERLTDLRRKTDSKRGGRGSRRSD